LQNYFKNLLIVELASVLAGPAVGMFFAELGATVIKIENKKTNGDVTRSWKMPKEQGEFSAYYHSVNWGKATFLLDLETKTDREEVLKWLQKADIVICNFKAGSEKRLGFDFDTLHRTYPKLIYASVSAYGDDNPAPGFDAMIQAETGWIFMNGEPMGNPVKMPVALMDILAAHQLKEGILVALLQRQQTGKGSKVSVSLFDSGVAALANQASNWLNLGILPQRAGSQHPNIAPYGDIFYTKDEKLVILGTGTQKQFEALCMVLGIDELVNDDRFSNNRLRLQHRNILNEVLQTAFKQYFFEELQHLCIKNQVTIAPINDLKTVFEMPEAQRLILEKKLADGTVQKCVKTAVFKIEF
jgi:crotonobetainyl-CoA:carnitine CoA-transferase CaiB-like acyl-CoA transferase